MVKSFDITYLARPPSSMQPNQFHARSRKCKKPASPFQQFALFMFFLINIHGEILIGPITLLSLAWDNQLTTLQLFHSTKFVVWAAFSRTDKHDINRLQSAVNFILPTASILVNNESKLSARFRRCRQTFLSSSRSWLAVCSWMAYWQFRFQPAEFILNPVFMPWCNSIFPCFF